MRVLLSRPVPSGHLVLARVPDGASFVASFADESAVRDVTDFVADLLLSGALDAAEQASSGRPEPAESVQAALLAYLPPVADPGAPAEQASFTWVHLPTGDGGDFPPGDVLPALVRGLGVELTAGVAHEAVEEQIPQDPAALADEPRPDGADASE